MIRLENDWRQNNMIRFSPIKLIFGMFFQKITIKLLILGILKQLFYMWIDALYFYYKFVNITNILKGKYHWNYFKNAF